VSDADAAEKAKLPMLLLSDAAENVHARVRRKAKSVLAAALAKNN